MYGPFLNQPVTHARSSSVSVRCITSTRPSLDLTTSLFPFLLQPGLSPLVVVALEGSLPESNTTSTSDQCGARYGDALFSLFVVFYHPFVSFIHSLLPQSIHPSFHAVSSPAFSLPQMYVRFIHPIRQDTRNAMPYFAQAHALYRRSARRSHIFLGLDNSVQTNTYIHYIMSPPHPISRSWHDRGHLRTTPHYFIYPCML